MILTINNKVNVSYFFTFIHLTSCPIPFHSHVKGIYIFLQMAKPNVDLLWQVSGIGDSMQIPKYSVLNCRCGFLKFLNIWRTVD